MTPIPFRLNPANVTITDGIGLAVAHLRANLLLWLLPVLAYAAVTGALAYAIADRLLGRLVALRPVPGARPDQAALEEALASIQANIPALIGYGVLLLVGGIAISWLMYALAVGGLPGRRMTVDSAISAGLRSILVGLLFVLAAIAGTAIGVLVVFVVADRIPVVLLVLVPAIFAAIVYLGVRFLFVLYALFDGQGVIASLRTSWTLTDGGVLRTLGWLLMLVLIAIGVSIVASILGAPFGEIPVVASVVSGLLTTGTQLLTTVVLAILYESQRMRWVMTTPGAPWLPGEVPPPAIPAVPSPAIPAVPSPPVPGDERGPLAPPPPPPPA